MLALQKAKSSDEKCSPNILPCRVHHDGPVNASPRYWNPQIETDGSRTAYFRGRRLVGTVVSVPDGFKGVVLEKTERVVETDEAALVCNDGVDAEADLEEEYELLDALDASPCVAMDQVASFDEFIVWGHEAPPSGLDDPYCKGVGEWVKLASAMHSFEQSHETAAQSRN